VNLPNFLTVSRIFLAAAFVFCLLSAGPWTKPLALVLFLTASATDYWDGRLARQRGQVSNFGGFMDPLADKVLTLSAFVSFVRLHLVNPWLVAVIVLRDIAVTAIRSWVPSKAQSARESGKQKTVFQMAFIGGVLLFLIFRETAFWPERWTIAALGAIRYSMVVVVLLTLWSGVRYAAMSLKNSKRSAQ
jgi:CDP-diacylglycerol--glycerol-3-phosphate 3-phosphatidyltransferase